jgi:conjugative relaxase-like TrwC/TraI family protein
MMGLAKMAPDGWEYYARDIAGGREDYFAGHLEDSGRWVGRGSEALGLSGVVDPDGLSWLFGHGRHPATGETLGLTLDGQRRRVGTAQVAGYALSFAPPKSVSVLWGLADGAVSAEVRRSHDAAVEVALEFLQEHAAFTRRGRGGVVQADTDGYLAAAFTHRTSRAGDPQLHTHVLVANKVRAASDGAWLALDGRELYEVQKAAGLLYKAAVRAELTVRLGVAWSAIDADGGAEIEGVPAELVALFSKRRAQVEAAGRRLIATKEAALGRSLSGAERAAALQLAAYQTRAGKDEGGCTTAVLRARWHADAEAIKAGPERWIGEVLNRRPGTVAPARVPRARRAARAEKLLAELLESIEERHSTWGRADVVEAVAVRIAPDAAATASEVRRMVEGAADYVLARPEVVALGADAPPASEAPAALARRDGLAPTCRHGGRRFSTWNTLRTEQAILELAEQGRSAGVAVTPDSTVELAIEAVRLGEDQADAVRRLCGGGEQIAVLVGPAGSGKSRSLAAARAAWISAGINVCGVAPSAVAAGVLTEQAGIPADTLARFLIAVRSGRLRLQPGQVIVCDEASMVSTRDLASLAALTRQADAKLVLAGDHRQLGAVDAGGLFRPLASDAKTAELTTVRRFTQIWEADATRRLRHQDISVIDEYEARDRVSGGDRETVLDAAHLAWFRAQREGRSVVVMAADHDTVDALALRARATRIAAGQVEAGGIVVGNQAVGVGDDIITTANDRRLVTSNGAWVRNGDRWQVLNRHADDALVLVSLEGRGKVTVPGGYVAENVALAYAVTVHKSQGLTVDEAVLVVDRNTTAEHLYVGLTRGRHHNQAWVVCEPLDDEHRLVEAPGARDVLAAALRRSGSEWSATETWRAGLDQRDDAATLRAVLAEARRQIDAAAGPDRRAEIDRLRSVASRQPELIRQLVAVQQQAEGVIAERHAAELDLARALQADGDAQRKRGWLRGPDPGRQAATADAVRQATGRLRWLDRQVQETRTALDAARVDHGRAQAAAEALEATQAAQEGRERWLNSHPEVVQHVSELVQRIRRRHAEQLLAAGPLRGSPLSMAPTRISPWGSAVAPPSEPQSGVDL